MAKKQKLVVISCKGVDHRLSAPEARDLYNQLVGQRDLFMTDFLVNRDYVHVAMMRAYPDLSPAALTKRVGNLWGRIGAPHSLFDRYSSEGDPVAKVGYADSKTLHTSARNLQEHHAEFNSGYQRNVGEVTKRDFNVLIAAIKRDLKG